MAGQALSETNGHKLTVEDIQEIRRQYAYGRQRKLIAKQFGISVHSVWKIAHGLAYKESGNGMLPTITRHNP